MAVTMRNFRSRIMQPARSVFAVLRLRTKRGPVETVAQATAELNRLRTQRSDDTLPQLGRTPIFTDHVDTYLATIKLGKKKLATARVGNFR